MAYIKQEHVLRYIHVFILYAFGVDFAVSIQYFHAPFYANAHKYLKFLWYPFNFYNLLQGLIQK